MKRVVAFVFTLIAAVSLVSCGNNSASNSEKVKASREKFIRDSIARAEFVKDSIATAQRNAEVIAKCANLFTVKTDEFSDKTWVKPKDAPKYRNRNGVYCYFATKNGVPIQSFRFVYQYYASDWLFIKSMIFNIDGENITIVPDMETDCGDGGKIWEWCDASVNLGSGGVNEEFIKKIANATSVKVKMNGRQYYDTRELTAAQIQSIKNTYEYYLALGGKF